MKVRYRPALGVLFLFLGGLLLAIAVWRATLGEATPMLAFGPLALLYGVLFLVRPYFWVHESAIAVVALFGPPVRRTFEYQALLIEDGTVYAVVQDTRTKVPVKRWLARQTDWRATIEG
jgi:hypothetical protein